MSISQARSITRVIPGSVAFIGVDFNKKYKITPQVNKRNIRMGMIAVPTNFASSRTFYHRVFPYGDSTPFQWQAKMDGTNFGFLYFYALLPWSNSLASLPSPSPDHAYDIGLGDGEADDLAHNQVATITVDLKATAAGGHQFHDTTNESIVLPAEIIEFAEGFHKGIYPKTGSNGEQLDWAHVKVLKANSKSHIEVKARIHVISGRDGQDIIGFIDADHFTDHAVPLGPVGTTNNNVNLMALIAPTVNPEDPNDFTFEVGDPEKNGRVTVQNI